MESYNKFAQEYAKGTEDLDKQTRLYFYSLLPPLKGQTLLDVGCGSGHDAEHYVSEGAIAYGLDISEKEIEMAKQRTSGIFVISPMEEIPFESNTFDIVTSVYAIQNSEDVPKSILEMIRVTKPGGMILILAKHPFRNLLESYVNDGLFDYYSKREVTSYIFNKSIKLIEQGHTMMDYLDQSILSSAKLELFQEKTDFPASDQVISGLIYPTYMILKYQKLS